MGFAKRLLEQEWEQGFRSTGDFVCDECIADQHLSVFVRSHASETACSFCDRDEKEAIAAPLDDVIKHMLECIRAEYSDVDSECVPYDKEDERYIVPTKDTWDLLRDELDEFPLNSKLADRLLDSISDRTWCHKNPQMLSREEGLGLGWREFCRAIKHDTRYLFFKSHESDEPEYIDPSEMLSELGTLIHELSLITTLPAGTKFIRVRCTSKDEQFTTPADIGPPPAALASTNRMSAAGIAMFYGAEDETTAITETRESHHIQASIGTFETIVPMTMVNLDKLPGRPSIFSEKSVFRSAINFIWDFRNDVIAPIERDDRVHYEYSPTQVVTEYLRRAFTTLDGKTVDGIVYPSSRDTSGVNYVFFSDRRFVEGISDDWASRSATKKFRLLNVKHISL